MYDPPIYRFKTQLMQRLARAAHEGYYYYISGKIHFSRVESFVEKMDKRFNISASKSTRYRRKLENIACAKLYLYPIEQTTDCWWCMVLTDGEHPEKGSEKWNDCRQRGERLILWGEDYELIRKSKDQEKSVWTWRIESHHFDFLKSETRNRCRDKNAGLVSQTAYSLLRAPGFSMIRTQVKEILDIGKKEFTQSFGKEKDNPFAGKFQKFVRLSADEIVPLSVVLKRFNAGETPFFPPFSHKIVEDSKVE